MSSHGISRPTTTTRSAAAIAEDALKIEKYNNLVSEVQALRTSKTYTKEALALTSKLLTQNPEFNTIWNFRRRIILHLLSPPPSEAPSSSDDPSSEAPASAKETTPETTYKTTSDLLTSELQFLIPLLQSYPKCYWIWNYRLFLLQTATSHLPVATALKFWRSEMLLVEKMLSRDSRNFHGWGYRRIVLDGITSLSSLLRKSEDKKEGDEEEEEEEESLAEQEFKYTTDMIMRNMSNFSAWHQRSKLIPQVLRERKATAEERRTFLDGELELMHEAVYTDPFDQSLHLYNHWLIASSCSTLSSSDAKVDSADVEITSLSPSEKSQTLERTLEWMKTLLEEEEPECRLLLEELIFVGRLYRDALSAVGDGEGKGEQVTGDLKRWLGKLIEVDWMRGGRWREVGESL